MSYEDRIQERGLAAAKRGAWLLTTGQRYATGTCTNLPLEVCTLDQNCTIRASGNTFNAACVAKPGSRAAVMGRGSRPDARITARVEEARNELHQLMRDNPEDAAAVAAIAPADGTVRRELHRKWQVPPQRQLTEAGFYAMLGPLSEEERKEGRPEEDPEEERMEAERMEAERRALFDELQDGDDDDDRVDAEEDAREAEQAEREMEEMEALRAQLEAGRFADGDDEYDDDDDEVEEVF